MPLYKGYACPYPEFDKNTGYYYIVDDTFGWFEGYSPVVVTQFWQNKVDTVLKRRALDSGDYKELSDDLLGCNKCGAVIFDWYLHSHR